LVINGSRFQIGFFKKIRQLYPSLQKTTGIYPWMNATDGPSEARRAKEGASADFAEEMRDTTGVNLWKLHPGMESVSPCR
jgi:hypothetical protein